MGRTHNSIKSSSERVYCAVPQGSILGSQLFLLYIMRENINVLCNKFNEELVFVNGSVAICFHKMLVRHIT